MTSPTDLPLDAQPVLIWDGVTQYQRFNRPPEAMSL